MRPYVGITGFATRAEAEAVYACYEQFKCSSERLLHVGVMTSYKQLHGIESSWKDVFPKPDSIADLFPEEGTYNCLHYADYDNNPGLKETLVNAVIFGGEHLHALQLDMVWPDPNDLFQEISVHDHKIEVILQVGENALNAVDNNPQKLVEKLAWYQGVVDRILLDKSMGRGLGMSAKELLPYAEAISTHYKDWGLVAAGGLGPKTLHLLEPLIIEFPNISFDAQGQLCENGNARNPLNIDACCEYLQQSLMRYA